MSPPTKPRPDSATGAGDGLVEAGRRLEEANRLFQREAYEPARDILQELLDSGFDSVEMRLMLGYCERKRRRSFDALRHFELAAESAPSDYRPPFQMGCAWDELGDHAQAEPWYRRSLSLSPNDHRTHINLGNALQDMGRKQEAIASYRRALALSPSTPTTWYNLATALFDHDQPEPAMEALQSAVGIDPEFARARFNLGTLHWLRGDERLADACMEKVSAAGYEFLVSSFEHVKANWSSEVRMFGDAFDVLGYALAHAPSGGVAAEFGVSFGNTIRYIAAQTDRQVYGFDSFEGLPEAWENEPKGMYSTRGILPAIPANVELRVGWFEDTLPAFVAEVSEPLVFANVDCDLYSSTRDVLNSVGHLIPAGAVICFDEYLGYETWKRDEYRAFQEYIARSGRSYRYLAFSFMSKQAVVQLTS